MRERGDKGEEMAGRVLQRAGYFILSNNYCVRGGEIDIIARAPDGTVVFVEVKLRAQEPEDHRTLVPFRKLARIRLAAKHYLLEYGPARVRFDLILLVPGAGKAKVFWYKDLS
jgi:putative endonuclease